MSAEIRRIKRERRRVVREVMQYIIAIAVILVISIEWI